MHGLRKKRKLWLANVDERCLLVCHRSESLKSKKK